MECQGCAVFQYLACWRGSMAPQPHFPCGSTDMSAPVHAPPSMQDMDGGPPPAEAPAAVRPPSAAAVCTTSVCPQSVTVGLQSKEAGDRSSRAMLRWAVDTEAWQPSETQLQMLVRLLPPHEQTEVSRFMRMEDRKRALASRLLQRAAVAHVHGIPWHQVTIERTRGKKPFAAHDPPVWAPNFNFNVSHEGSFTVLASEPVAIVGVDVSDPHHVLPNTAAAGGGAAASPSHVSGAGGGGVELIPRRMQLLRAQFSTSEWDAITAAAVAAAADKQGDGTGTGASWQGRSDYQLQDGQQGHTHQGPSSLVSLTKDMGPRNGSCMPKGDGHVKIKEQYHSPLVATFQRLWSLKEAFIKARGDGLGFEPLSRASFTLLRGHGSSGGSSGHHGSSDGSSGDVDGRDGSSGGVCSWGQAATLEVDGVPQPRWSFRVGVLAQGHVVSVARGPPSDIVDAWGVFRARLALPDPTPPELHTALHAPHPPWRVMDPLTLLREAGVELDGSHGTATATAGL